MNKLLTGLLGLAVLLTAVDALATPEQDRQAFIKLYTQKYPNIKVDDYVYGALAFDADSRAQYNAIMEFPPYESVVDQGRKMWDAPFKNGKKYGDCFPNEGKQIAETTLTAIMGREAAYTGQPIGWDEVMNSTQSIQPPTVALGSLPVQSVAMPGQTKLHRTWSAS